MTKTKLVPLLGPDNQQIGHIPLRASKNPVIGVIRCECGEPASVHNPKGRRSGYYYTMCDDCKTNQSSGDFRQTYLRENMVQTVEELPDSAPAKAPETPKPEQNLPELDSQPAAEAEPPTVPELTEKAPVSAKPEPLKAANNAAYTASEVKEITPEPQAQKKPIALFAACGFVVGGLLALVA
jgi:hypothetical protein